MSKWAGMVLGLVVMLLGLYYFMNSPVGSLQAMAGIVGFGIGIILILKGSRKRRVK